MYLRLTCYTAAMRAITPISNLGNPVTRAVLPAFDGEDVVG